MSIQNASVTLTVNVYNLIQQTRVQTNDVAISTHDGNVYFTMTDTFEVFRVLASESGGSSAPGTLFADQLCGNCTKGSKNGPNGIALYPGSNLFSEVFITSIYGKTNETGFLYSVSTSDGAKTKLRPSDQGYTRQIDGLTFDSKFEFLFGMSHGYNAIVAMFSCDGWTTEFYIAQVFSGGCATGDTTTAAYTSSGDLLIYCGTGFTTGPYTVSRISNIRKRILGSTYSSTAELCDALYPGTDDGADVTSTDDDNKLTSDETAIVVLAVFLFFAVVGLLLCCCMWFRMRDRLYRKDEFNGHGVSIESPLTK